MDSIRTIKNIPLIYVGEVYRSIDQIGIDIVSCIGSCQRRFKEISRNSINIRIGSSQLKICSCTIDIINSTRRSIYSSIIEWSEGNFSLECRITSSLDITKLSSDSKGENISCRNITYFINRYQSEVIGS